jgi:anti-sigma B factor antagonist
MEIEVSMLDEDVKKIRLVGRLDMKNTLLIDSRFSAEVVSGASRVLVDLSGVEFLASIAIRLLVIGAKTVAARGGKMALCCTQPTVAKTLAVTGIEALIPTYDEANDAVNWLRGAS